MNNAQKKQLRRGLSGIGSVLIVFSIAVFMGIVPGLFFPLNTPYLWIVVAFILFISRTYIKDKKLLWTSIGFFERSGLTTMVDVAPQDITPTHIRYKTPDGEERRVKHFHGFSIPSEDGYDIIYLTPRFAVEALNPARLFRKYAPKLTEEVKTKVQLLYRQIVELFPEAAALDPDKLTIEETENDDNDRLNQELASTVSDIKRGFLEKTGLKENWFFIFTGILIGMIVITFVFMGAGIDFRGLINR